MSVNVYNWKMIYLLCYREHAILEDRYCRMRKVLRQTQFLGVIPEDYAVMYAQARDTCIKGRVGPIQDKRRTPRSMHNDSSRGSCLHTCTDIDTFQLFRVLGSVVVDLYGNGAAGSEYGG
jgi:hypothetical protein